MSAEPRTQPGQRALRLVPPAPSGPAATAAAIPAPGPPPASPALRSLQRDLEAARAEARCLQELVEELPAILERKFHLRLQAILSEQRQLEADNAILQHHLFALGSAGLQQHLAALQPSPRLALPPAAAAEEPPEDREDSAITQGLGLRRALRLRHR